MDSRASLAHHHVFVLDAWHYDEVGPGFTVPVPIVFDVPEYDGDPWDYFFSTRGASDIGDPVLLQ